MGDLTKSRSRQCPETLGGESKVFLFNRVDEPFTVDAATNETSALNALVTEVYSYDLSGDGNTLEESMVGDIVTGTRVNSQTATLVLKKMTVADSAEFNLLASSCAHAVVLTRNGDYIALGVTEGCNWTIVSSTGAAKADFNGYTVTGIAQENKLAPYLDSATVIELLAAVV